MSDLKRMSNLDDMSLTLHFHRWEKPQEWASKFDALADLTDEQIDSLVMLGAPQTRPVAR